MNADSDARGAVAPVDLEIRVTTPWGQGERAIRYVLTSHSGVVDLYEMQMEGPPIHAPEAFRKEILSQVHGIGIGQDPDGKPLAPEERWAEMAAIGHDLYRKLFPKPLRALYGHVRDSVTSLLITSDEPWIPWEIVRPFEREDDDFLCMAFAMGRWMAGEAALATDKRVTRVLGLAAGPDLACAQHEIDLVAGLLDGAEGTETTCLRSATLEDMATRLAEDDWDLIHFAGHGAGQDATRPASAGIALGDRTFRLRHISPAAEKRLRARRPLVFLNSCHVARLGHELTEVDGWASRFVQRCSATAFLGPTWPVDDLHALSFADTLYGELAAGRPLGEAVRASRVALSDTEPGQLAWLAYSLYGHPGARIAFGPQETAGEAGEHDGAALPPGMPRDGAPRQIPRSTTQRGRWREKPTRTGPWWRRRPAIVTGVAVLAVTALVSAFGLLGRDEVDPTPAPVPPPLVEQTRFPLAPIEGDTVAVIALDAATDAVLPAVGRVLRSSLSQKAPSLKAIVRSPEPGLVAALDGRSAEALPGDGSAPWGAEHLLVARVSERDLPQRASHLIGLALSLSIEVIASRTGEVRSLSTPAHTGAGVTRDQALTQAAERCLSNVMTLFDQQGE